MATGAPARSYKIIYRNGYAMRREPGAKGWGYQYVHRVVAAEKLGRALVPGETVHHLNHDKLDNRPENLEVYQSRSDHMKNHGWPKGRPKPWAQKPLVQCPVCRKMFKPRRRTTSEGLQVDTATCSMSCGQYWRQCRVGPQGVEP